MAWKVGDRLSHRFNPDLGTGVIREIDGRSLVVHFSESGTVLRISTDSDAIAPLEFPVGSRALLLAEETIVTIEAHPAPGAVRLTDGREVPETDLWPAQVGEPLTERLARGEVDPLDSFSLRLDALHLAGIREADGLGSFLGGRIRLFPHQLYTAERATRSDPVRWLLADEVGLGKTVEACLILNHLLRTGRVERTLVVAPETLTVQWLGELWRKYHQVFVLLDTKRLLDVERDYGHGFNPFDAYPRVVVGLDFLRERPRLTEQAVAAGIDLMIVDEAHHLRRPPGHPGNRAYRAVRPVADCGRHVLLLTATPLDQDAHGFFRLLQLLRPEEFPGDRALEERMRSKQPLPPCTSATRRLDIGGLPPRRAVAVHAGGEQAWRAHLELERLVRALPADGPVARRKKLRRVRRALASGSAIEALLEQGETELLEAARRASRSDPRLAWLAENAPRWKRSGDRTLVFVAQRETLEEIREAMSRRAQLRVGVFHEELSPGQRDIEVAQFRRPGGPSMLVSTECGGEGRNFEFCTRMVLFDLPWNPMTVEQRIGRLDRIGRRRPVEIVYFEPPSGLGLAVARLFDSLGLYREPLGGVQRELGPVERAIEAAALEAGEPDTSGFGELVDRTRSALDRIHLAAQHELHRDRYRPEMAEQVLARIPPELEELTEEVIVAAAEALELHVEEHRQGARHSVEFVPGSQVDSLPGLPAGSSFLGSFDREEAVRDETIDFFASGHPLVEGMLAHLEESPQGRVTLLHAKAPAESAGGFGLLGLFQDERGFRAIAVDAEGRERPEWAAALARRPLRSRRVRPELWTRQPGWAQLIRALAAKLEPHGRPAALAAFRLD
jgi:ATP-dependent helicase HepA